jgi:hypothetical protein
MFLARLPCSRVRDHKQQEQTNSLTFLSHFSVLFPIRFLNCAPVKRQFTSPQSRKQQGKERECVYRNAACSPPPWARVVPQPWKLTVSRLQLRFKVAAANDGPRRLERLWEGWKRSLFLASICVCWSNCTDEWKFIITVSTAKTVDHPLTSWGSNWEGIFIKPQFSVRVVCLWSRVLSN